MTDESIINLSDETKSSLRIYATMAGFFIIAAVALYCTVAAINGQHGTSDSVKAFGSAILLIIGVVLAMLHKRDLFAAFFILSALLEMIHVVCPAIHIGLPVAIIYIIAALAFSQTRNEQRYIVIGLLLVRAVSELIMNLGPQYLNCYVTGILIVACFYFAFVLACERYKLPLHDMLVADEEVPENDGAPVHFKEMGSSIGYLLLTLYVVLVMQRTFGFGNVIDVTTFENITVIVGIILLITGAIMMVAGRMRGTPFYFMCAGFLFLMASAGLSWIPGLCFFILGIMIMLRNDSRILLGLGIILLGATFVMRIFIGLTASGIVATVAFLIFTYLVFAVNSNGKLKLV